MDLHADRSEIPRAAHVGSAGLWRLGDTACAPVNRTLAEETPVGLGYDGKPHVVLMATPADIEDLAIGFTLTERIAVMADIEAVAIEHLAAGASVNITLSRKGRAGRAAARLRTMEGRSSCGLCGVQRLTAAVRPLPKVTDNLRLSRRAIQTAV